MDERVERRTVLAGLAGLGTVGTGTTVLRGYRTRDHLDLRVQCRNEAAFPFDLGLAVHGSDTTYETRCRIEKAPENSVRTDRISGPWTEAPDRYGVAASIGTERLRRSNDAILESVGSDWVGPVPVTVTLVIDRHARLDATVERRQ